MAFDKPQSRNEAILQNMLGANNELEPPKSRVEALLQDIAGQMPEANPSEGTTTGTLERLKIGDEIYTVEGGGSGTSDYDALNNKPQIAGVTLSGDKSLADLGIASATTVSGILDGTDIDSFGDVETALGAIQDGQSIDSFADVETALSGKQATLTFDDTPTDNSNNPVKSNGIYDALALKQNATDNSLETTAKTIVGAINEHEGDVVSLKSGFTTLDNEVNGDATVYPYADVITIPDAVPANLADCTVKIEPVQDLHGQSAPYVGGAGKNKLNTNYHSGASVSQSNVTVTKNDDGSLDVTITGSCSATVNYYFKNTDTVSGLKSGNYKATVRAEGTYTGNIYMVIGSGNSDISYTNIAMNNAAPFTVSADDATLGYCLLQIPTRATVTGTLKLYPMIADASADMTTWAPYENICPITGHTEASVQRDGVNLFDKNNINSFGGYIDTVVQRYVSNIHHKSCYIKCEPNTAYTISKVAGKTFRVASSIDAPENGVPFINTEVNHTGTNITITTGSNARYLTVLYWSSANGDTLTPAEIEQTIQIEYGSSATDYEPYAGKTYTIALGDTIYGGTVDFDSGVMTVDRAVVDMGTLTYAYVADWHDVNLFYTSVPADMKTTGRNALCSNYEIVASSNFGDKRMYINSTFISQSGNIGVSDTSYNDATAFKTAMDGVQLVYELATPTTIQLTPQQIQLLKGTNTITASTGQISVTVNGVSGAIGAVQEQVNELAEEVDGITPTLRYTSATTGTHADKLATLKTAFDALTDKQKQRAYILYSAAKYSVGNWTSGIFYNIYYDFPQGETRIIMIDLNNVDTKMARLIITSSSTTLDSLASSEGQYAFMLYA